MQWLTQGRRISAADKKSARLRILNRRVLNYKQIFEKPPGTTHPSERAAATLEDIGSTFQFSIAPPVPPQKSKRKEKRDQSLPVVGSMLEDHAYWLRNVADLMNPNRANSFTKLLYSEPNRHPQPVHQDLSAPESALRSSFPDLGWESLPPYDGDEDAPATAESLALVGAGRLGTSAVVALDDECFLVVEGRVVRIPKGMMLEFSQVDLHNGAMFAKGSFRVHMYNDVKGKPLLWTSANQKTTLVGGSFDPCTGDFTCSPWRYTV